MRFSDTLLDEIRSKVKISDVIGWAVEWDKNKTNYAKGDYWACCPFHAETTPSFHCEDDKGRYHCFGCKASGDIFTFLVENNGMSFPDAVYMLAEQAGVHIENARPRETDKAQRTNDAPPDRHPDDPGPGFHNDDQPREKSSSKNKLGKIVKIYEYTDERGEYLFEVVRYEPKTFRQRIKDPSEKSGYKWTIKDARQVPYRLPEVIEAIRRGEKIHIMEGEKDVDNAWDVGIPATCNAAGSGKWPEGLIPFFEGARVVLVRDNDQSGFDHCEVVGKALRGVAKSLEVVDVPGVPNKGDFTDWLELGYDPAHWYDIEAKTWTEHFESRFHAVPWAELDDPGPEHEWLVKDVLTRGERSMTAGASQSGKSFLILDMALSIARGVDWMGKRTLKGGVIYQAGEGGKGLKKRVRAYRQRNDLTLDDDLPFVLLPAAIDLFANDDHTDQMIEEVSHWADTFSDPLELVVIDTLSAATPGANENTSEDMGKVLARCAKIAEAVQAHVMLVHHMNADGTKARGHTSIFANLDNVLIIRKVDNSQDRIPVLDRHGDAVIDEAGNPKILTRDIREVVVDKQKDGENGETFRFVLAGVELGIDAYGDKITSCVVEEPSSGASVAPRPLGDNLRLSVTQRLYMQALEAAIEEYGTNPPQDWGMSRSVKVVDAKRVATAYRRMSFEGDAHTDDKARTKAVTKTITTAGNALLAAKLIGREGNLLWITGRKSRAKQNYRADESEGQNSQDMFRDEPAPHPDDDIPI